MTQNTQGLPQIQNNKLKNMLSPFHWNNLALPALTKVSRVNSQSQKQGQMNKNKNHKSTQKHIKSPIKQKILTPIKEASQKQVKPKKIIKDKKQKTKSNLQQVIIQQSQTISHPIEKKRRYSVKQKQMKALNKTVNQSIELKKSNDSPTKKSSLPATSESPSKRIKFLNAKNNMEQYLKMNLTKQGWQQAKNSNNQAKLLWSNEDRPTDYGEIKPGQFYNHIKGSVHLTSKGHLHEHLQVIGLKNYPDSFLIPKQYDQFMTENNNVAIKKMLKSIAQQIVKHFQIEKVKEEDLLNYEVSLGEILTSTILQTGNEETTLLIRLCMYLQIMRIQQKYCSYFQKFTNFTKVNLKPKANLFDTLIEQSVNYLDKNSEYYVDFSYSNLDYRLLVLLLHYNKLFKEKETQYNCQALWIVKPIASSRGAGISILRSNGEFCSRTSAGWYEYKNRKKFQNKIMQKYIPNPYILQGSHKYAGRKFDIRQWVLVISHQQKPSVFKYHTAYCRFSSQKYTLKKLDRQIHLTNYSLYREEDASLPSVMMLEQLFSSTRQDLRGKYVQQSTQIVKSVIKNCHYLQYQQGCFELFGFDFLLDKQGKLHLLEINLNPACASNRYEPLRQQTETMAQTMLSLVTERKKTDKWAQIYGPSFEQNDDNSQIARASQIDVKPFYNDFLNQEESLIALIRHKRCVIFRLEKIIMKYILRKMLRDPSKTEDNEQGQKQQRIQSEIKAVEQLQQIVSNTQKSKGSLISPFWPH